MTIKTFRNHQQNQHQYSKVLIIWHLLGLLIAIPSETVQRTVQFCKKILPAVLFLTVPEKKIVTSTTPILDPYEETCLCC